jgi:hypothetical protein
VSLFSRRARSLPVRALLSSARRQRAGGSAWVVRPFGRELAWSTLLELALAPSQELSVARTTGTVADDRLAGEGFVSDAYGDPGGLPPLREAIARHIGVARGVQTNAAPRLRGRAGAAGPGRGRGQVRGRLAHRSAAPGRPGRPHRPGPSRSARPPDVCRLRRTPPADRPPSRRPVRRPPEGGSLLGRAARGRHRPRHDPRGARLGQETRSSDRCGGRRRPSADGRRPGAGRWRRAARPAGRRCSHPRPGSSTGGPA